MSARHRRVDGRTPQGWPSGGLRVAQRRLFLEDQLDGHTMVLPCRRLQLDRAQDLALDRGRPSLDVSDRQQALRMKVKMCHKDVFVVWGIRDVNAFDGMLVGERVGDELHYPGVAE
jgi:hypothetical protein